MDLEILEKFIEIIDENQPILSEDKYLIFVLMKNSRFDFWILGTFVFGILAEFGALLGPGPIKTNLIKFVHHFGFFAESKSEITDSVLFYLKNVLPSFSFEMFPMRIYSSWSHHKNFEEFAPSDFCISRSELKKTSPGKSGFKLRIAFIFEVAD